MRIAEISNSLFCVIPLHSCLFVLGFVSFFLDSKQKFFFSFVISRSPIQLHGESGDMEFFYQSSTRYLSSEQVIFHNLASHVET